MNKGALQHWSPYRAHTQKQKQNRNKHTNLRTVHMCARITVDNCHSPCTSAQFWLFPPSLQKIIRAQKLSIGGEGQVT